MPDTATLMQAIKSVKSLYASDYARAEKAGASKALLAKKLLETAEQTKNEPVGKYAALFEAKRLALEIGDVATTFQCVELLTAEYELRPLVEKTAVIELLGSSGSTVSTLRELSKRLLPSLEEAAAADDFRSARKIHAVAVEAARRLGDKSLSNRLDKIKADLDGLEAQFTEYTAATKKLEQDPRDKTANRAAGLYLGLRADRWEEGEKRILMAQDDVLHSLFVHQCSPPTDAAEQAALADAWWDWSQLQKGIAKSQAQALAATWYRTAQTEISGLAKTRADERLKSVVIMFPSRLAFETAAVPGRRTPVRKPENLLTRERLTIVKGPWTLSNNELTFADEAKDGHLKIRAPAPGDFRMEIEATPARVAATTFISLYFHRGNRDFAVQLAQDGSCVITGGYDPRPRGKAKYAPVWEPGKPNQVSYEVQDDILTVTVNGDEFLAYKDDALRSGPVTDFSLGILGVWQISELKLATSDRQN